MKKQVLFAILMLLPMMVMAYDFKVDGIYYNVVSFNDLTCSVTHGDSYNDYWEDVVIPAEVTYNGKKLKVIGIDYGAFEYESGVRSITIGPNVIRIEHNAFHECTNLQKLILEDGEESIFIDNYYSTMVAYGESAFTDCPLTDVYIGRNITYPTYYSEIGTFAYIFPPFRSVSTIKNLTFGDNVTTVGHDYYNCSDLQMVSFGKSVSYIEDYPFDSECKDLKKVYSYNMVPPDCQGPTLFPNSVYMNATLYIPKGAKSAYENAFLWKNFWNIIEISSDNPEDPQEPTEVPQDVNGDGIVDTQDVLEIYKYIQEH